MLQASMCYMLMKHALNKHNSSDQVVIPEFLFRSLDENTIKVLPKNVLVNLRKLVDL